MAQQIITYCNLQITGDDLNYTPTPRQQTVVMTGKRMVKHVQAIGFAAHEALVVTDLATIGWGTFLNQDDVNSIQLGNDVAGVFSPFLTILPNEESGPVRLTNLAIYAKAAVASCNLDYTLTEA